jgi:hypothetical protein
MDAWLCLTYEHYSCQSNQPLNLLGGIRLIHSCYQTLSSQYTLEGFNLFTVWARREGLVLIGQPRAVLRGLLVQRRHHAWFPLHQTSHHDNANPDPDPDAATPKSRRNA